jgi:hypothetical protein
MQAPPEPMQLPLDECMQTTWKHGRCNNFSLHRSDRSAPPDRPVPNMCTGPALWPVRLVTSTSQTGAQQSPENLLNASDKPFQAQTSPPCWQCMNQAKNAKLST